MTKIIIQATPKRKAYVDGLIQQLSDVKVVYDDGKGPMDTFLESLIEEAHIHLEDDVILCEDFEVKAQQYIDAQPNNIINFFRMGKNMERCCSASTFSSTVGFYLPNNYGFRIKEFYGVWSKSEEGQKNPTGFDTLIRRYAIVQGLKYVMAIPNLVDHRQGPSELGPRNSNRRSHTFHK